VSTAYSMEEPARAAAPVGGRRAWVDLLRRATADRVNQAVFVVALAVVGLGYSILLPFDFTQRISFDNWQYFDARYVAFTVAFAFAMAWVITLQVHATRAVVANARRSSTSGPGGPLRAVAALVSLLPSFLCCSPIVPTLVGLLGLSATTRLRATGSIEHFFATQQDLLLLGSLALVIGSGLWSMRKIVRASCLADHRCAPADDGLREGVIDASTVPTPPEGPARRSALAAGTVEEPR
jgi:hypothetical protein